MPRANVTYHHVLQLHAQHPDWDSNAIAASLGCLAGYVRATAQRRGLKLPTLVRSPKKSSARKNLSLHAGDDCDYVQLGAKEQLVELFFDFFMEVLPSNAVFEPRVSLSDEFKAARKHGQSLTGFLLGDPLPERSALRRKI